MIAAAVNKKKNDCNAAATIIDFTFFILLLSSSLLQLIIIIITHQSSPSLKYYNSTTPHQQTHTHTLLKKFDETSLSHKSKLSSKKIHLSPTLSLNSLPESRFTPQHTNDLKLDIIIIIIQEFKKRIKREKK